MLVLKGTGIFKDIVVGRLMFYERQLVRIDREKVEDIQREMMRPFF